MSKDANETVSQLGARPKKVQLTDLQVRLAAAGPKAYKLYDSGGLYLYVTTAGHRSWRMKYRFDSKERRLLFGEYPNVKLSDARKKREAARRCLQDNQDPGVVAKASKLRGLTEHRTTFEIVAREWHSIQAPRWKPHHAADVLTSLKRDAFPHLGSLPIGGVDEKMLLALLRKVEARGAIESAHRLLQRLNAIFKFSKGCGNGHGNPVEDLKGSLSPVPPKKRWPAITKLDDLRSMITRIDAATAHPTTKLASRVMALTAQRPGMVRSMLWIELEGIDWTNANASCRNASWRISADRMKIALDLRDGDAFEHVVPLSAPTVEALRAARQISGQGPLVFPGSRSLHNAISENAVGYLYNREGYKGIHVAHGWRSSFSTIMNGQVERAQPGSDRLVIDRLIIDLMLAHMPSGLSDSERIYNRSAYTERRREIADGWASMIMDGQATAYEVLTGRRRRSTMGARRQ